MSHAGRAREKSPADAHKASHLPGKKKRLTFIERFRCPKDDTMFLGMGEGAVADSKVASEATNPSIPRKGNVIVERF